MGGVDYGRVRVGTFMSLRIMNHAARQRREREQPRRSSTAGSSSAGGPAGADGGSPTEERIGGWRAFLVLQRRMCPCR